MTGEREEYVVERWPEQDDIVYGDPLRVEVPHNVGDQPRAGYDRDFEPALPGGPANGAAGLPCEDRHGPALVGARGGGYLEGIPPDPRPELGRPALRRGPARGRAGRSGR